MDKVAVVAFNYAHLTLKDLLTNRSLLKVKQRL